MDPEKKETVTAEAAEDPAKGSEENALPEAAEKEENEEGLTRPLPDEAADMPSASAGEEPPPRDLRAEAAALMRAHPELRGGTLPDEVFQAAQEPGRTMLAAYDAYLIRNLKAENEKLREENAALKQNEANAARAPITAVNNSAATAQPEDPFLRGFFSWGK